VSLLEPVLNGLIVGGLYGLFGLGLAFAFGIMRIVHIAHGEFIVLAAYLGASLLTLTPLPLILVVPCVGLAAFATGWLLQAAILNRVVGPNPVPGMIITIGLSIVIRNAIVMTFGADIHSIEVGALQDKGIEILGVSVGVLPLIIFAVAVIAFIAMHLLLTRTTLGRAFRAAADDFEIVETLGFNRRRIYSAAMGLAIALSALAGLLLAMRSSFSPYAGVERLLISFEVVIVGGLGSLPGCFFGGLFIGVAQVVGLKLNPNSGPLFGHLAFFVVLLAKQMDLPALLAWKRRQTARARKAPWA
jgi:branched-chain amino acid transport system permease protein